MTELTEERLAQIEKHALLFADDPLWEDIVAPLLQEVRRLRTERDDARGLLRHIVAILEGQRDATVRRWVSDMRQLFVKWADGES
jgi:hypothetical protein